MEKSDWRRLFNALLIVNAILIATVLTTGLVYGYSDGGSAIALLLFVGLPLLVL